MRSAEICNDETDMIPAKDSKLRGNLPKRLHCGRFNLALLANPRATSSATRFRLRAAFPG